MRKRYFIRLTRIMMGLWILVWLIHIPKAVAAPVPGVTDDTITIGVLAPLSGPAALLGKSAQLWQAELLEWGKNINGRNIKVIMLDDGCDPIKGIAATKKLIFEDKVFMICGGQCSNQMLAVKPVVEQAGIPYLVVGAVADSICIPVVKNIFHAAVVSTTLAQTMADFAMTVPGVKKLGIIRHTDEWAQSIYNPLVEYLKTQHKRTLDVEVTAERGTGDLNAQVLKLKQEKVDCLINILFPAETTALLRAAYNLGLDVPIVSNPASPASEQYESLRMIGPVKKYFGLWSLKYPLDHPKVKVYENLWQKYYPNIAFSQYAVYDTQGPLVVIDGLKKCGRDVTWEKFINILETNYTNWEPENYIGAFPLSYSKTNHVGLKRLVYSTIATGKLEIVRTYQDYEKLMK